MNEPFFFDEAYSASCSSSQSSSSSDELDTIIDTIDPIDTIDTIDPIDTIDTIFDPTDTIDTAIDIVNLVQTVERGLQASVFQVEPVTHITYQLLFVDNERNVERVERHVMHLREANVIDMFDIARIIKRARGTRYRLTALIVYNVDLTLKEILRGGNEYTSSLSSRFATSLLSLSNFKLRPTLACFHSVNSVHVVLSRNPSPSPDQKRHVSIHPSALTRSRKRH